MKPCKIREELYGEALKVCGSLHRRNSPNSIGYLFNPDANHTKVLSGMFCDLENEINGNEWRYYISFKDYKTVYELEKTL